MPSRLQWKCCFRYELVPPDGIILLSERGHFLLRGAPYFYLAPLLNGQHTANELVEYLHGRVSAAEVFYALDLLQYRYGYIVEATSATFPERAAFWELLNINSQEATKRLKETTVSIVSFGAIDPTPLDSLLASLGIQVREDGEFYIVLSEDYLCEELATFNVVALAHERPWLLVKPIGTEVWIGPLFLPGVTACWTCLAHRLQGSRKVESYLQEKKNTHDPFSSPPAVLPSTLQTAYSIAATEIVKWIARGRNEAIENQVFTFDTLSLAKHSHQLVRRPQCSHCGTPAAFTTQQAEPLVLRSCKKSVMSNGGHRTLSSEETWKKLEHHISPISGIVSGLQSNCTQLGEQSLVHSYLSGHNFVHVSRDEALDLGFLCASLQGASGGKGKQDVQAKVSALCEAIERYSGVFQGNETRVEARLADLGVIALHPNACMLFSEQQFKKRARWNSESSWFNWVPEPFNEDKIIEWSPVWSLTYNEHRYLPTAYCYYGYSRKHNTWFARADSNGCAAGHTKEEAILQGFMELVERDSVALWWYNRLKKPAVDLSNFAEPYFHELQEYYRILHRDLWVLDLTSDLNIPTFAAISCRNDKEVEDIIFGFGTHFDSHIAILRALTEVNQSLPAVASVTSDNRDAYLDNDPKALLWWKTATLENHPYLTPDATVPSKTPVNYPKQWSDDLYTDVLTCVQIAKEKGLETLVLDQTRPDTGLHVVKVFVPGLRHFWARFAPGRLYEIPAQMGWRREALNEQQLNPHHIYF